MPRKLKGPLDRLHRSDADEMPRMAVGSLDNAGWVLLAAAAVQLGLSFVVVCYVRDARTGGW